MGKKIELFNKIAVIYGIFFKWQVRGYDNILENAKEELEFPNFQNVLDIGCGTGALCKVLNENGFEVTGVDPAEVMLAIARKKTGKIKSTEPSMQFIHGDVLEGLPFQDKSFDIAISSYVAHGFMPWERTILYNEMRRVAREKIILLDYNKKRSIITDILEWLEGGDYFNFIEIIRDELINEFGNLKVIHTGKRSAMYICELAKHPKK